MGLKIRFRKQGRTNLPCFRLVVTDCRTKRDGKYLEALGWYNPTASNEDNIIAIKADRIAHWLAQGAEITERAKAIVKRLAPEVIRTHTQSVLAHRAKVSVKRRNRRKAAAKAAAA
jgi:small subunit ribosomal protein S16